MHSARMVPPPLPSSGPRKNSLPSATPPPSLPPVPVQSSPPPLPVSPRPSVAGGGLDYGSVKLFSSRDNQTLYEHYSDLYALLLTVERIERAYVRDLITDTHDYTALCSRLIGQYKTLRDTLGAKCPDLHSFCQQYGIHCPAAILRLSIGIPATMIYNSVDPHQSHSQSQGHYVASLIFKTTQSYITVLDALKLGLKAVDQLVPLFNDIVNYTNQLTDMPVEHEAKALVRQWLILLNGMRAHEELTSEQARQCEFDLQKAYDAIYRFLEEKDKKHAPH